MMAKLSWKLATRRKVFDAVQAYTGREDLLIDDVLVYPDPKVEGTVAARILNYHAEGEHFDVLFISSGEPEPITEENLSEAEFECWPPKSGALDFFA
jgi:hypothetical protein